MFIDVRAANNVRNRSKPVGSPRSAMERSALAAGLGLTATYLGTTMGR